MGKIPKNLSDKEMFKDYEEEPTIEETFQRAERAREAKAREKVKDSRELTALALSPEILDALEKLLLEVKVELYREGIVDYRLTVRREGTNILLSPAVKKK